MLQQNFYNLQKLDNVKKNNHYSKLKTSNIFKTTLANIKLLLSSHQNKNNNNTKIPIYKGKLMLRHQHHHYAFQNYKYSNNANFQQIYVM